MSVNGGCQELVLIAAWSLAVRSSLSSLELQSPAAFLVCEAVPQVCGALPSVP